MANREIRDYATFSGANDEGYLIIGGIEGVEGGKKLLSNIEGSNVPNYPTDVGIGDVNRYELKVHNRTQGGMQVLWDKAPVYAADSHGGLVLRSGQTSYDYAINTNNANNGDVLTYSGDNIVWSAPAGGTSLPDTPSDYTSKSYVLGFNKSTGELAWQQISNGSGGVLPYV